MKKITTLCLLSLILFGCASTPYSQNSQEIDQYNKRVQPQWSDYHPQVEVGKPHAVLDAADWIWPGSWLGKLILWDRKVDSHQVSKETIETIKKYVREN